MTDRDVQPGIEPGIFSTPVREPDNQTRRDLRRLDTDEDRRFWSSVDAAAREVETWPAWRRGVSEDGTRAEAREVE